MKIAFYSPAPLTRELGAPKVIIELAEEMEQFGWKCTLIGPEQTFSETDVKPGRNWGRDYRNALRRHIGLHAGAYDVIEYDHGHFPFPRSEFSFRPLFVARSVLLVHHFERIRIPGPRNTKAALRAVAFGWSEAFRRRERARAAHQTVMKADLVNVCCSADKKELLRCGIDPEKVVVLPFGIDRRRRGGFDELSTELPAEPIVVFVGTFDFRKGASDMPLIFTQIAAAVPGVRFRLLGVKGLFRSKEEVLKFFPKNIAMRIDVVPSFAAETLPSLLLDSSVGIFPSYVEGFPFGVLEMLAASIPVIAYDSPGAPDMLNPEWIVAPGSAEEMARKVIALLQNSEVLREARAESKQRSREFSWSKIAAVTAELYADRVKTRSKGRVR